MTSLAGRLGSSGGPSHVVTKLKFMEVSKLRLAIKSMVLAIFVALSLIVAPALSVPCPNGGQGGNNSSCPMFGMGSMGPGQFNDGGHKAGMGFDGMAYGNGGLSGCISKNASLNYSGERVMRALHSGRGFAMSDNGYHALKVNVMSDFNLDTSRLNGLVSENKTLGQIKSDIEAELDAQESAANHSGLLVISSSRYVLKSIEWTSGQGENATLEADVAGPINFTGRHNASEFEAAIEDAEVVGHLSMAIADHDDRDIIGQGQLTMNSGKYSGTYKVLVNMDGGMGRGKGMEKDHGYSNGMISMGCNCRDGSGFCSDDGPMVKRFSRQGAGLMGNRNR
jgi:hypothetical protein